MDRARDRADHVAAHARVSRALRQDIEQGVWEPGAQLPSEHALMQRFGVSRNTVRHALQSLETANLVRRRQGAGTFVTPQGFSHVLGDLRGFTELIAERGHTPGLADTAHDTDYTPPREAIDFLGPPPLSRLSRVQTLDGDVFSLSDSWLPAKVGREISEAALRERVSLYRLLREDLGLQPREATESIRAQPADGRAAELLGVPQGAAMIVIYRWTLDQRGAPLEYARSVSPGDRHEYVIKLHA